MRVVFVTHNRLGLACIEELVSLDAEVQAIYTRSERDELADQTDIGTFADSEGISLHRIESVNTEEVKSQIAEYKPELLFVIGWSRLVDSEVLDIPSVASLGMHPAPLPRGRGRAPLAWSIIKGLDETALSLFHLVEEADAGDIVGQEPLSINTEDNASSLYDKMVDAGRELINRYYPEFESGKVPRTPQDESKATWWPKREPHHGLIDWTRPPNEIYDWIRGQTRPYPGAFSYIDGTKVIVWDANPPDDDLSFVQPGEIVYKEEGILGVGAWEGIIEITEVEISGENSVSADSLVTKHRYEVGDRFTQARDILSEIE
jgi:methionyl-tRNA formyltransferase